MSDKKQRYVVRMAQDTEGVTEEVVEVGDARVCDGCRLEGENAWKTCDLIGIEVVTKYLLQRIPDLSKFPEGRSPCAFVSVKFPDDEWETIKNEIQADLGLRADAMSNGAWFKVVLLRNVRMTGDAALDFEPLSEEEALAQAAALLRPAATVH